MKVCAIVLLCLWLLPCRTRASESPCSAAAAAAEQEAGLPPGLLLAIGQQESGLWDAAAGKLIPWPFAINAAGESRFFATKTQAVDYIRERQRSGVQSIDIGCFQINLLAHPFAFRSLDDGLDPRANARYAAGFLRLLYSQAGNWDAAVAHYHSTTPGLGEPYRDAVFRRWTDHPPMTARAATTPSVELVAGVTVQRPSASIGRPAVMAVPAGLPRVVVPGAPNRT